jgi:hypothetical protein
MNARLSSDLAHGPALDGGAKLAGFALAATLLVLFGSQPALAAAGDGVSEIKVIVSIGANPALMLTTQNLQVSPFGVEGFGVHDELAKGDADVVGRVFTDHIAATAFADSPPTSRSKSGVATQQDWFARLTNLSDAPQDVLISFSGDIFLSAAADTGASAAAKGRYKIRSIILGAPDYVFEDARAIHSNDVLDSPKAASLAAHLNPGAVLELRNDFTRAFAFAAAPEPAAWLLMLGGFCLTGRALRHRQRLFA